MEPLLNSSAVDADSRHIAKHHVAILATHRTWKGGGFDMATLPAHIKSYNPKVKLFKYMNANQLDADSSAHRRLDSQEALLRAWWRWKTAIGGSGLPPEATSRDSAQASIRSTSLCRRRLTRAVCNGRNGSSGTGMPRRLIPESWVAPAGYTKGRGLKEGDWDGVFLDGQYISTGVYAPSNADYNNDRLNDPPTDLRTRNWVAEGHTAVVNEWRKVQPSRFVTRTVCAPDKSGTNRILRSLTGVHDGGLLQDITRKDGQKGGWPVMMKAYRRGLSLAGGPKIVIFHNKIKDLLDDNPDMSVYQANRYGLTSALMDNGYYAVMAPGQLRPEFDEFFGGKIHSASKLGYLGYPKNPPQTSAWSQGVYRREFDKGLVLVNPKGNGTRTVNVGSGWRRIDGGQDRTVNNGQSASSVTLKEQDGIILLRAGS